MVARIGHPKLVLVIDRQRLRPQEFARCAAVSAPFFEELSVAVVFVNTVELAVLGNIVVATRVLHGVGYKAKLTGSQSVRSADLPQQFPLRRVNQQAMIM